MDKEFIEQVKKEASTTLHKVFDKIEEVSKISQIKIKINNKKNDIKKVKREIGDLVYNNREQFKEFDDFDIWLKKIDTLEEDIIRLQEKEELIRMNSNKQQESNTPEESDA